MRSHRAWSVIPRTYERRTRHPNPVKDCEHSPILLSRPFQGILVTNTLVVVTMRDSWYVGSVLVMGVSSRLRCIFIFQTFDRCFPARTLSLIRDIAENEFTTLPGGIFDGLDGLFEL